MVDVGETVILGVIAELFQTKEVPPLAVSVVLSPLQIEIAAGEIAATGF